MHEILEIPHILHNIAIKNKLQNCFRNKVTFTYLQFYV